jgi:LysM repeat protein
MMFGVPWQQIAQMNNIQSPYVIYVGEALVIP